MEVLSFSELRAMEWRRIIGRDDGSIMATIIASHITMNIPADSNQLWFGIRIHIMDIVQPPGMGMPPDMERQK
jgi:hypothetical protein